MTALEPVDTRRALPGDALVIAELHASNFRQGWSEEAVRKILQADGNVSFVALMDARTVGFLLARAVCDEAEIISLAVDSAFRRRGCGSHLLAALEVELLSGYCNRIFLEVDETNVDAVKLYGRHGFVKVGLRHAYYTSTRGQCTNALVLTKNMEMTDKSFTNISFKEPQ